MSMHNVGYCLEDKDMVAVDANGDPVKLPLKLMFSSISSTLGRLVKTASNTHIIPEYTPISNQGGQGSCVANAWCDSLEILDGLSQGDAVEQLSRQFLYNISRILHGALDVDGGTYNRAAAHQLTVIGTVEEKYYQYDQSMVYAFPEADLYTMASNHRLEGAYTLTSSDDQRLKEIEIAIRTDHPVVFGTPVGNEFMAYRGEDKVLEPEAVNKGRHAMILTGVRTRNGELEFYLRNSWGLGWGFQGHAWVSSAFIARSDTSDIWVPTKGIRWTPSPS